MRRFFPWALLAAGLAAAQTSPPIAMSNLLPKPASVSFASGRLVVDSAFSVHVEGHSDARLLSAVDRFTRRLQARSRLQLAAAPEHPTLVIRCLGPGQAVQGVERRRIVHSGSDFATSHASRAHGGRRAARFGNAAATGISRRQFVLLPSRRDSRHTTLSLARLDDRLLAATGCPSKSSSATSTAWRR